MILMKTTLTNSSYTTKYTRMKTTRIIHIKMTTATPRKTTTTPKGTRSAPCLSRTGTDTKTTSGTINTARKLSKKGLEEGLGNRRRTPSTGSSSASKAGRMHEASTTSMKG